MRHDVTVTIGWSDWKSTGEVTTKSVDIESATYNLLERLPPAVMHEVLDAIDKWNRHQRGEYTAEELEG